jgi:glycosyltransferase involved in cell wall biosynthesis
MSSNQPVRIMRIITELQISGPALQAVLLTASLNRLGYEGLLVSGGSGSEADSMAQTAAEYGIETAIVPEIKPGLNLLTGWRATRALVRLMRAYKPDVVHTHTTSAGFYGRIAARIAGIPVVVHTLHEHPFRGYYNRLQTVLFIMMERIGARLSDSIITLSEGLRRELIDTYRVTTRNRINVLPVGFDLHTYAQTPRRGGAFRGDWQIEADVPLIGVIGRLLPVKNLPLFLQAAKIVHQKLPHARFAVVGDGEERAALQALARELGLGDAVIFTGWQRRLERIYSDLDVLVNSSWNEGTPIPIIESLAAGCPVVATAVGGIPDLLDRGRMGMLVPADDAQTLADAILSTLAQPPDMRGAQRAMQDRYGIDRLAQDVGSLYRGLLTKKRR